MSAEDYMPDDLGLNDEVEAYHYNPNNCGTCKHKKYNDMGGGWCYMFREEPTTICMQHTGRDSALNEWRRALEKIKSGNYE